jgi:hypothetical protein
MPIELFISCADVLSTVGGPVVVVTTIRSPPGMDHLVECFSTAEPDPGINYTGTREFVILVF